MNSGVKDIDRGWKRIKQEMLEMKGAYVKIGVLASAGAHKAGKITVAEVALANEYGVPEKNIPPRPFMRQAREKNEGKIRDHIKKYTNMIFGGVLRTRQALLKLGAEFEGDLKREINEGKFAPNAPSTIARKTKAGRRGDTPLRDTGQMAQSIKFEVGKE